MNKAELIERVAALTRLSKAQTENSLDATMIVIKNAVHDGQEVKLVGFGTFLSKKKKARNGRNPQTGESIQIPATVVPKFRISQEFKRFIANNRN